MWRFHPQTDELVRLVRSGAVGEVRYVHAAFAFGGLGVLASQDLARLASYAVLVSSGTTMAASQTL